MSSTDLQTPAPGQVATLIVAMVFPTFAALVYFLYLGSHPAAPWVYALAKALQFAVPLLALSLWRTAWRETKWSRFRSLCWGLATGTVATFLVIATYRLLFDRTITDSLTREVAAKTHDFGVDGVVPYVAMSLFLSLAHSALEEYYWRGFVFGLLDRWIGEKLAILLSSLAFMSHHVVVISRFVLASGQVGLLVVGCLAVALGGAVWAWQYARSGSLLAPWIGHVLADLALMTVGYLLLWG